IGETHIRKLTGLGIDAEGMRRILNAHKSDPAQVHGLIDQLSHIRASLPAGEAESLLNGFLKIQNFAELAADLHSVIRQAQSPEIAAQLLHSIVNLGHSYGDALTHLKQYLEGSSLQQQQDLSLLLSNISAEGQHKVFALLTDMNSTLRNLNYNADDARQFIAQLINLAANGAVKQHVDLINRSQAMLNALAKLPDSAERQQVLAHLVDTLVEGGKPLDHALDIRAASRALGSDGSLSDTTLQRFAENIRNKQPMAGGDAFRLHIEDAMQAWKTFAADPANRYFVELLNKVSNFEFDTRKGKRQVAELSDQDKALLAEIEPWFRHLTDPQQADPTNTDPARRQPLTQAQQLTLLARLLSYGMQGAEHIDSADVLRHVQSEVRDEVVGARAEPDFIESTRRVMREMGFSEE
ncbi:MAG TPA: hypothetical protein VFM46_13225, partial [Pseudomonadales bacterium]|nr:hypothetical protein [Pseudomonadales bacterium]